MVLVIGGIYVYLTYAPYLQRAQEVKQDARQVASDLHGMGLDTDVTGLDKLQADLEKVKAGLDPFRQLLASDPLVHVARSIPVVGDQINAGDAVVAAATNLGDAGDLGLQIGREFLSVRASAQTTPGGSSVLADLVHVMASSRGELDQIANLVTAAKQELTMVPDSAFGQIRDARDLMADPIAQYGPLLSTFQQVSNVLPDVLGLNGEKRYLVLAEDPAELRPTGGFTGTVGIVTFQDGRLVGQDFQDVYNLDLKPGVPYQTPPPALAGHLLGADSWQLADANWSPDFPTSAQDAVRLYSLESGDTQVDGVIAITTYALDRVLSITGPVTVAQNTTVKAGDVTMTVLQKTRSSGDPNVNRKEVLDVLATQVVQKLFALPSAKWAALLTQVAGIGNDRLAAVWFKDPAAESLVSSTPWGGAVRQDPGDYVFVVDSNVSPSSKYNLVIQRSSDLTVQLDQNGDAHNALDVTWKNNADMQGEPYASLRSFSISHSGMYGDYVRVLVPNDAGVEEVAGGPLNQVTGAERLEQEAGRTAIGRYLLMPPGTTGMSYRWTSPGVVAADGSIRTYQVTIQKQPGQPDEPLTLQVRVPPGERIIDSSPELTVNVDTATLSTTLTQDMQLTIQYRAP